MIIVGLIAIAIIVGVFATSGNNNQDVQDIITPTPYRTNEEYSPTPKVQGTNDASSFSSPPRDYDYDSDEEGDAEDIEEKKSQADDLSSRIQDLNWEIGRLRRNTDSYDHDEFSSKLKKLRDEADDLSWEASDIGSDDTASSLDDVSSKLRRLRNEIDWEESYFYREREDEVESNLKRSEWYTEDAQSSIDDFYYNLDE